MQVPVEDVLDRITEGFYALDRDWRLVCLNERALDLTHRLDLSREQLAGKSIWELAPELVGTALWEQYYKAMTTQTPVRFEFFYQRLNEWFTIRAYPSPEGLSVLFDEITEAKFRDAILLTQARLLDLAYEPILVRDAQDRIMYWNHGAERLYGYISQEASGQVCHDLLGTQFPEPLSRIQAQLYRTGLWEGDLLHRTKNGHVIQVASRWQRFSEGEQESVLETNFDLSHQKALEVARIWKEKGKLIAELAHQINNPLEAASGATHMLKAGTEERAQYLAILDTAIRRIADFIREANELHESAREAELLSRSQ